MIRARSPFFYFNFLFAWLAGVFGCLHWASNWELMGNYPEGAEVFQTIDKVSGLSLALMIVFLICLAITATLEIGIGRGWEPKFLETFKPGCEVLSMSGSSGDVKVLVRLNDGSEETYIADRDERRELQIGMICHLWVIGKYVSRIMLIAPGSAGSPHHQFARLRLAPDKPAADSAIVVGILLLVSTLLTGTGARYMIVKEFVFRSGRSWNGTRSTSVTNGSEAVILGLVMLLAGVAIIITLCVLWKRGWDTSELVSDNLSYDKWS